MSEKTEYKVDWNNIKLLKIKKNKSKFKTFTNASLIPSQEFQPYLGKPVIINVDRILSIYPAEDEIGTWIFSDSNNGNSWKVLEDIDTILERISE